MKSNKIQTHLMLLFAVGCEGNGRELRATRRNNKLNPRMARTLLNASTRGRTYHCNTTGKESARKNWQIFFTTFWTFNNNRTKNVNNVNKSHKDSQNICRRHPFSLDFKFWVITTSQPGHSTDVFWLTLSLDRATSYTVFSLALFFPLKLSYN